MKINDPLTDSKEGAEDSTHKDLLEVEGTIITMEIVQHYLEISFQLNISNILKAKLRKIHYPGRAQMTDLVTI